MKLAKEILIRKGHELWGENRQWQMMSVQGPLENLGNEEEKNREYFRIETSTEETLLVSREVGERGMRHLHLLNLVKA